MGAVKDSKGMREIESIGLIQTPERHRDSSRPSSPLARRLYVFSQSSLRFVYVYPQRSVD